MFFTGWVLSPMILVTRGGTSTVLTQRFRAGPAGGMRWEEEFAVPAEHSAPALPSSTDLS